LEAAENSPLVAWAEANAVVPVLSSGVLDRHGFVGSSGRKTLYLSTIAGNFGAMQNVLPKLKLSLSRLGNRREH
jgi:hypothetical protein